MAEQRIIPWVAMWSGEKAELGPVWLTPEGVQGGLDTKGIKWIPYGNNPGIGVPLFGEVHSLRQLSCMVERRCQVCGLQFAEESPVTFVLSSIEAVPADEKPFLTTTPPTCPYCAEIAVQQCPHLAGQEELNIVAAHHYDAVAVWGDTFEMGKGPGPVRAGIVRLDSPTMAWTIARQLVVAIHDYNLEVFRLVDAQSLDA